MTNIYLIYIVLFFIYILDCIIRNSKKPCVSRLKSADSNGNDGGWDYSSTVLKYKTQVRTWSSTDLSGKSPIVAVVLEYCIGWYGRVSSVR